MTKFYIEFVTEALITYGPVIGGAWLIWGWPAGLLAYGVMNAAARLKDRK